MKVIINIYHPFFNSEDEIGEKKIPDGENSSPSMWNTSAGVEIRQENPVSNPAQVDSESKVETGEEKKPDGENNSPPIGVIKNFFKAISFEKMNTTRRQKPHKHQKLMGVKPNDGFQSSTSQKASSQIKRRFLQRQRPGVKYLR